MKKVYYRTKIKELEEKMQKKTDNDHDVIHGLVVNQQDQAGRNIELIQMISDLQNEVTELKKQK